MPGREGVYRYRSGRPAKRSYTADDLARRFEERSYRGRMRRATYWIRIQTAYVLALLVVIGAFRIPIGGAEQLEIELAQQELVELEDIVQTQQIVKPPPPPRPPVPVEVPDEELIDDEVLDLDASLDIAVALEVPPPPPEADEQDDFDEDEIFVAVEQQPEIVGGVAQLHTLVKYPEIARKAQMEGTVVVQVVVNTDGSPSDPKILRSAGAALDKAAQEAVMKLEFKPGKQRNRPVRTLMAIPVKFQLS